ncbi:MAG TPA: DNA replication and repair protein RecF [Candidatus Didemnitutus sp.]|nr:DNA replication and repair protein RecF [Candidatus Didemnitutus sp.]
MRFRSVTLQNFRNLPLASVEFAERRTFLVGANGQGKSNFLEALGYVTALRSFRGAEPRALVAVGAPEAGIGYVMEHETLGESRVTVTFGSEGREVTWEQGKVTRLGDFIGKFPTVAFSAQDNQLLRGAPALRRRWLDLTLAAMDPAYLVALQGFTRAVAERNILLKHGGRDLAALAAFEKEAAAHAVPLVEKRATGIAALGAAFDRAHAGLVPGGETAGLVYAPDVAPTEIVDFAARLERQRARDLMFKSTTQGPHRDDLDFTLGGKSARMFASEGQQRCVVLALRLAQAAYFKQCSGVQPVLLCDDVLGELDADRRERFWSALDPASQVVATGTALPADAVNWQTWSVVGGRISPSM